MLGQNYPIGNYLIYPYWVCFDLAFIIGGAYLILSLRPRGIQAWKIVLLLCILFPVGLGGARLFSILEGHVPLSHFFSPREGLTYYGGLLTCLLVVPVYARVCKIPLTLLLDKGALAVALGYGVGRIGCFLTGDGCYGSPSNLPWAMAFPHGDPPVFIPVHPAPLYETALGFLIFLLGHLYYSHKREDIQPGTSFIVITASLAISRCLVETIRLNPRYYGLSQAQWISVGIVSCLIVYGIARMVFEKKGSAIKSSTAILNS